MAYFCLYILLHGHSTVASIVNGYFLWKEEGQPIKRDVLCPESCRLEGNQDIVRRCCACQSKPVWELTSSSVLSPLDFERIDIPGKNRIEYDGRIDNETFLTFEHRGAFLTELPENMCDFSSNFVVIDVAYNSISQIYNIECLWRLDTLDLSYNKLTILANETFLNMSNLRILDVSHNNIKSMEPGFFHGTSRSIYKVNLSFNHFNKMDVSNVIYPNATFCSLNYSNAIFGDFTNDFKISLKEHERIGCGDVVFDNCLLLRTHLNAIFSLIQNQFTDIFKYNILGNFTYNNVFIPCDCTIGEAMARAGFIDFYHMYHKNELGDYKCRSPERMKGIDLTDVHDYQTLDQFICVRSTYCPENCTCFEQPSQNRFVVNCSYQSYSDLPSRLPVTKYPYYLDLTSNHIKHIRNRTYTHQISHLLLDGNEVQNLDSAFLGSLSSIQMLTLKAHDLLSLPKAIEKVSANKIIFGQNSIPCDCDSEWIARWRIYSKAKSRDNPMFCRNNIIGIKHVEEIMNYLDCSKHVTYYQIPVLVTLLLLLASISVTIFIFKEELRILKCRISKSRRKSVRNGIKYDVFISFDENSLETRNFVVRHLRTYLINEGYSLIVPCIQLSFGDSREKETESMMKETRCVIIVLTNGYGKNDNSPWTTFEYNRALKMYFEFSDSNIILVNFEGLNISNTSLPYLKALKTVNGCLHVTDRKRSIYACVKVDGRRTDGRTDRRTSSIYRPELLCNPAKNVKCCLKKCNLGILRVKYAIDCNF
ncbi:hypothetical protein FSP39_017570 [Pinctada imbricata]|uniref:TIR domain-containing protein n=1 Tax=Pinctada imbricata TaxID=66713 RepID=A0AA88Y802_PINIB|nr:hypothetical protein FSP39_017570 [Pinctada imbricata]